MKLDKRPLTTLTLDIIRSSPMWMIIYRDGSGSACHAPLVADAFPFIGLNADKHTTCYPCKSDAPFEPIPWSVVEGEEIIEALYNVPANHTVYLPTNYDRYICNTPSGRALVSMPMRPGYHPSPRRFIDTDGSCVPVWIWEKNQ